jgi:chitinase
VNVRHVRALLFTAILLTACDGGLKTVGIPSQLTGGPVADAGPDQATALEERVDLDGSRSRSSRASHPLRFAWVLEKPAGSKATLQGPTSATPSVVPDVPGIYVAKLVVLEDGAGSATDTATVEAHARPVAEIQAPAQVKHGDTILADGSGSVDPLGQGLHRSWGVLSSPEGTLTLGDDGGTAHIPARRVGTYVIGLTVHDASGLASATAQATVEVVPSGDELVANAGPDRSGSVGAPVILDGSGSRNLRPGDAFRWNLLQAPNGSQPVFDVFQLTSTMTGDRPGLYRFHLQLQRPSSGEEAGDDVEVRLDEPVGAGDAIPLPFQVYGSAFSAATHRLLLLGDDERLHIVDPASGTDEALDFPLRPTALGVSDDGAIAAVGHDAHVSVVDVAAGRVVATWRVGMPVSAVAVGSTQVICFSGSSAPHAVELATGRELASRDATPTLLGVLHPDGVRVYSLPQGYGQLQRWDLVEGRPTQGPSGKFYVQCGPLWMSHDGDHLFTGCGQVLRTSSDPDLDMGYSGSLQDAAGSLRTTWVDTSAAGDAVVAVLRDGRSVGVFDGTYLQLQQAILVPGFSTASGRAVGRALAVYFDRDDRLVLVERLLDDSGNVKAYGVATLPLP